MATTRPHRTSLPSVLLATGELIEKPEEVKLFWGFLVMVIVYYTSKPSRLVRPQYQPICGGHDFEFRHFQYSEQVSEFAKGV